ncbi:MAG: co-chaperone GroES [Bacteroidota bacterium]
MKTVIPLNKRVLIKRLEIVSKASLIISVDSKEKKNEGIVIAKGSNVTQVEIDDEIMFAPYTGNKIEMESEGDFLIINEDDIIAIIG